VKQAKSVLLQLFCRNCISVDAAHPPWSFFTTLFGNSKAKLSQDHQGVQFFHMKAAVRLDGMPVLQISLLHFAALCDGAVMHRQRHETNVELSHC